LKLALTRTPDPIRPTHGRKEGRYDAFSINHHS